jgi:hypothetical protein
MGANDDSINVDGLKIILSLVTVMKNVASSAINNILTIFKQQSVTYICSLFVNLRLFKLSTTQSLLKIKLNFKA